LGGDEETGELPVFEDDDVSDDESNEVEDNEEEQDHLLIDVARLRMIMNMHMTARTVRMWVRRCG
jgi:hypothetical protein